MVNWDPGSRSAISDLEVEEREVTDTLYCDRLPARAAARGPSRSPPSGPRPCSPTPRSPSIPTTSATRAWWGRRRSCRSSGARLQIIADPYVKPEFGTGALKITPGHDPNDFEIGRAHGLEEISAIGEDGRMTAAAGERFAGLTALEAREAVVDGAARGGPDRPHRAVHAQRPVLPPLGRADRAADLAAVVLPHGRARRAGDRGRARRPRAHPPREPAAALLRLDGEHPPVVHLAPAVVGAPDPRLVPRRGRLLRASSRPRARAGSSDPDVLDTWFSSALWPFATLGWPDGHAAAARVLPDRRAARRRATSSSSGSRA